MSDHGNESKSIKMHRRESKWNKGILKINSAQVKQKFPCTKWFFKQFPSIDKSLYRFSLFNYSLQCRLEVKRRLIMFRLKKNRGLNMEIVKAKSILICAWSGFIAVIIRTAACSENNFFEQKGLGSSTCFAVIFLCNFGCFSFISGAFNGT